MDKIEGFKITGITMSGFSCFKTEKSFDMDDLTYISGGNHVGKTSIANAIAFAIAGTNFYGEPRMLDELYNEDIPEIEITMNFIDNVGKEHVLIRRRKNDKMSISYDGYSIRQADLTELFGERDVFLSIFNPLYFIETLAEDGKGLLERYLPAVSHEAILEGLSEYQQTLLKDESLLCPDVYISKKREEIRELENSIVTCQGQKDLLITQRSENAVKLKALQADLTELVDKIKLLTDKKTSGMNEKTINESIIALTLRYDELLADKPVLDTSDIDSKINEAILSIERTKTKSYESKYADELVKITTEYETAHKEHVKATSVLNSVAAGMTCPQCLRLIDENSIGDVKSGYKDKVTKIVSHGKTLQSQLKEIITLDTKAKEVFEQFQKDDIQKQENALVILRAEKEKSGSDFQVEYTLYEQSLQEIQTQIQSLNEQLLTGNLSVNEHSELLELEQTKATKNAEYEAIKEIYKQNSAVGLDEKIRTAEEEKKAKNQLVYAALEYAGKRAELTFSNLVTANVKIVLYKVLKTTSELKNVFQFTYKNRSYKRLSHSEKLLAGVETAELIKRLTGRNYPMFIDDAESIDSIPKPSGQALLALVRPKTPLTVKSQSKNPPLAKAS